MGRDKSREPVGGRPSLLRVLDAAREALDDVTVVGGHHPGALADLDPGGGPVQAVVAAFRARPGRDLVVVACDLPFLDGELLRRLAAPLPPGADGRVVCAGGRDQPLCARYAAHAREPFEAARRAGVRAMWRVLEGLRLERLDPATVSARAALGARDFDTPGELAELLDELDGVDG